MKKAEILVLSFFLILTCFISVVAFTEPDITLIKTQQRYQNFTTKGFTKTGDPTVDMPAIALLQEKKSGVDLGYTEDWCADFVGDCAVLCGVSAAIPTHGACSGLLNNIVNAGGKQVTTPKAGDIAVFYSGNTTAHVGIMVDATNCVSGNYYWSALDPTYTNTYVRKATVSNMCSWDGRTVKYYRPAYNTPKTTTTTTTTVPSTTTTLGAFQLGDVNNDNIQDIKDLLVVRYYLVGETLFIRLEAADVDVSGTVDMKDVLYMRQHLVGILDSYESLQNMEVQSPNDLSEE